jgi:hypothetical protein
MSRDTIKELLSLVSAILGPRERIILSSVLGFAVGLFIGLVILGWNWWTVDWKDAAPADLHPGYRQIYLETVAHIYDINRDIEGARRMLGGDTWSGDKLARNLNQAHKDTTDPTTQTRLYNLGLAMLNKDIRVDEVVEAGAGGSLCLGVFVIALVIFVGAAVAFMLLRARQRGAAAPVAIGGDPDKIAAARTQFTEEEAPIAQFVTSYAFGDDLFNPDFGIETASGGFLGSCGVGLAESIGAGEPKRVTAFDVWLFDTNPPTTVTKVMMSEYCYQDSALRDKLASKGEALLGHEGSVIELETSTLRVQAKVLEMEYGAEDLPPNSFVTRLTMELNVWQIGEGGGGLGLSPAF